MSDRFEDERDEERRPPGPTEGVRILGAEEARSALAPRGERGGDGRPAERPRPRPAADDATDVHPLIAPDDDGAPAVADEPPTWSASGVGEVRPTELPSEPPTGDVPPLPHWTEPPTGAVPAIFADDAENDEDLDAWAALTGSQPRFRAEGADWAEADYIADDLSGEHERLGALAEATPVDDEAAFAEELAARRRRPPRGRAARTMVTTPPPAPRTARPPRAAVGEADRRPAELQPPGPTHARDLPRALVTAGVVGVIALICFTQGPAWTNLLAAVVIALGSLEFTAALRHKGFRPAAPLALVASAGLPLAAREYGTDAYPIFFGLVVVFALLWFLWEVTPGRPLVGVATTVLAFGYVGGLGGFAGLLLASDDGIGLIAGVAICAIAYDVVGFFVGSQFGKSPIAPRISPNKSFEGTFAGMLASVALGWLFIGGVLGPGIFPWSPGRGAVLGLFVAVGAFLGDLCESLIKRDIGIKDFGSLLPGHGGVLDRFDALLFCLPITYYLALHFKIL